VPTDIAPTYRRSQARSFALRGAAWSLGLFGLIRLGWFEAHAVLPITQFQATLAAGGFGVPALPVETSVACSGADAVALCAAAVLAYPAVWRMRLAGAAGGVVLIVALNILRIGTLGRAAGSAFWFQALHVYVWPAVLMVAIAGYVFAWMHAADAARTSPHARSGGRDCDAPRAQPFSRRFVWTAGALVVGFTALSPWYLDSAGVLAIAAFVARAAAFVLRGLGVPADASANLLSTPRGAFLVTQECISTPLIPLYVAAAFSYVSTWRLRAPALLAALPLFIGLGVARLLVVALPPALVDSPFFVIHAFYQMLLAAVLVCLAAIWRHGSGRAAYQRALAGAAVGATVAYLLAPLSARALSLASGPVFVDPQGALALLPAFQIGLYLALSVAAFAPFRTRPFTIGLAAVGLTQLALVAALVFLLHRGFVPHVRDVRALAIAGPVLVVLAIVAYARPRH
jgi:exosortase/archaeosortase family protein